MNAQLTPIVPLPPARRPHLAIACAELADAILHVWPGFRIVATSREPFGIAGELAWRVPSLMEEVRLFVDRAAAAEPFFRLNEQNSRAAMQICRRLDGIPLAIELAARRRRASTHSRQRSTGAITP